MIYQPPTTIKCSCGYDTGLNQRGFYMIIPQDGLKCPRCGKIIIHNIQTSLVFGGKNNGNI